MSLLGPFFNVDDISEVKMRKSLYADDICYMHNVTAEDCFEETQQDIGSWTACSKLTFIESKTVWMHMSRKHHHHFTSVDLHLNRKRIIRVKEVCYLEVLITTDLTWSAHIHSVI